VSNNQRTIVDSVFVGNSADGGGQGGAIAFEPSGNFLLQRVNASRNRAGSGGAFFLKAGSINSITMTDCILFENTASGAGGALFISSDALVPFGLITRSLFHNNVAVDGGALFVSAGSALIDFCVHIPF
jgi:hypothetical protein